MKIIVFVEGGIVQTVMTDEEAEVMVVDYDVDGVDLGEIRVVNGDEACVYVGEVHEVNADRVGEIFALKAPKSNIVRKAAEDAGIPVVEIETEKTAPEDLKGFPVPKGWSGALALLDELKDGSLYPINKESGRYRFKPCHGAGIPDGQLSKAITTRPTSVGSAVWYWEIIERVLYNDLETNEYSAVII